MDRANTYAEITPEILIYYKFSGRLILRDKMMISLGFRNNQKADFRQIKTSWQQL